MVKCGIRNVAQLAGVSIGTVSKILNSESAANIRVSDETRQKVLKAAEKLDYRPSYGAKLLRGESTRTIGFATSLPKDHNVSYLSTYTFRLLNGIGPAASKNGYQVLLLNGVDYRYFMNIKRMDALIMAANSEQKFGRVPGLYKPEGIVGDICDPFNPAVREDLDKNFAKLAESKDDPTIIGYFIANEQPYPDVARKIPGFDGKIAAKRELVKQLAEKYGDIGKFNAAWKMNASGFDALADMLGAVNPHRTDRRTFQRREQNPPQRIAERMTISALKRRRDELGVILGRARIIDDDRLGHRKTDRSSHIFPPT